MTPATTTLKFKAYPSPLISRIVDALRWARRPLDGGPLERAPREKAYGNVKVLVRSKEEALATMVLYAPCSLGAVRYQSLASRLVNLFGPRALIGRTEHWSPPMDDETWVMLLEKFRTLAGGFDGYAPFEHSRAPTERLGLLLLSGGRPRAFAKLRAVGTGMIRREAAALEALAELPHGVFEAPRPYGDGQVGRWRFLVTNAVFDRVHLPALDVDVERIAAEIQRALAGIERPADIPSDWVPIHGDLTPWNLRRRRDGRLVLVDWEEAGWGPPGADRLRYAITAAEAQGRTYELQQGDDQLIEFWTSRGRVGW